MVEATTKKGTRPKIFAMVLSFGLIKKVYRYLELLGNFLDYTYVCKHISIECTDNFIISDDE